MAMEAPGASLCEESMGVGELEGRADLSVRLAHQEVSAEVGGSFGFLLVLYADKDSGDSGKVQIANRVLLYRAKESLDGSLGRRKAAHLSLKNS